MGIDKSKKVIGKKETFGAVAQIKKPKKNTDNQSEKSEKSEKESDNQNKKD